MNTEVRLNLLACSNEELVWFLEACNVKKIRVELKYDGGDLIEANLVHPRK